MTLFHTNGLTTMKHQSNQAHLNSSKAEQNSNSLHPEEQDAFIRAVNGKQQLFPFFCWNSTICVLILVLYSPIPFCIIMFLVISPPKKVILQLLERRKRSNINYQDSHRQMCGRQILHVQCRVYSGYTEYSALASLHLCFFKLSWFLFIKAYTEVYMFSANGLLLISDLFVKWKNILVCICSLELSLEGSHTQTRWTKAFGYYLEQTLGSRSNMWNHLSVELSNRIPVPLFRAHHSLDSGLSFWVWNIYENSQMLQNSFGEL